jgi:hypothetical protein
MNWSIDQYNWKKVLSSGTEPKVLGSTREQNSCAVKWTQVLSKLTEKRVLNSVTEPKVLDSTSEQNSCDVEWTEVLTSITEKRYWAVQLNQKY